MAFTAPTTKSRSGTTVYEINPKKISVKVKCLLEHKCRLGLLKAPHLKFTAGGKRPVRFCKFWTFLGCRMHLIVHQRFTNHGSRSFGYAA